MAKQKQDNKTVDIELLILRDKIECLIDDYADYDSDYITDSYLLTCDVIKALKGLLEN